MASIYVKQGKYWLRYLDPTVSPPAWRDKPTPLRYPEDARKARQLKLETTVAERRKRLVGVREDERFDTWVPQYLEERYGSGMTYDRYVNSWTHLSGFMDLEDPAINKKRILTPAAWTTDHNAQYVSWKEAQGYSRNMGIYDLGVLRLLMNEAKRKGFITEIKASKARIRRAPLNQKAALTDEQIESIRAELKRILAEPPKIAKPHIENLAAAFEIGLHTGCRLMETQISFDRIDLKRGTITYIPKGGEQYAFTAPIISDDFKAWLGNQMEKRRAAGHTTTCSLTHKSSGLFSSICRRLKLRGPKGEKITFHCLRVTFVTRAFEAGLSGEIVRRLVGHSDILINRVYQRMSIEGLQALGAKLSFPRLSSVFSNPGDASSPKPKPRRRGVSRPPKEDRPRAKHT